MSEKEFAKQVLTASAADKLKFLSSFYTSNKPELMPLFECVQESLVTDDKNPSNKQNSPSTSTKNVQLNTFSLSQKENPVTQQDVAIDLANCSCSAVVRNTEESESFDHIATCYAENPTLPICSSAPSVSGNSKHGKSTKANQKENLANKLHRTIISETESDSDEELDASRNYTSTSRNSQSANQVNNSESEVVRNIRNINSANSSVVFQNDRLGNSDLLPDSSVSSSVVSNVFDRIIGTCGNGSLEYSCEGASVDFQADPNSNKDYNNFLDRLLFDDAPKAPVKTPPQNENVMRAESHQAVSRGNLTSKSDVSLPNPHLKNKRTECRSLARYNQNAVVEQSSSSYNKVLDNLLFGGVDSTYESLDTSDSTAKSSANSHMLRSKNLTTTVARPSTSKRLASEEANRCIEPVASTSKHKSGTSSSEEKLESSNKENEALPSSLELSESLWNTLDQSYEY